jgi:hypothetical protein
VQETKQLWREDGLHMFVKYAPVPNTVMMMMVMVTLMVTCQVAGPGDSGGGALWRVRRCAAHRVSFPRPFVPVIRTHSSTQRNATRLAAAVQPLIDQVFGVSEKDIEERTLRLHVRLALNHLQ